jgi:hypothetical protein
VSLRSLAESDLGEILGDTEGAGTPFVLVDKGGVEYPVTGVFGDIGFLIDPSTGAPVQGRSIVAACRIRCLEEQGAGMPGRGWKVRAEDLSGKSLELWVHRNEPDRTIGLYRLTLGATKKGSDDAAD